MCGSAGHQSFLLSGRPMTGSWAVRRPLWAKGVALAGHGQPVLIGSFPRSESGIIQGELLAARRGLDGPKGPRMLTSEHFGGPASRERSEPDSGVNLREPGTTAGVARGCWGTTTRLIDYRARFHVARRRKCYCEITLNGARNIDPRSTVGAAGASCLFVGICRTSQVPLMNWDWISTSGCAGPL